MITNTEKAHYLSVLLPLLAASSFLLSGCATTKSGSLNQQQNMQAQALKEIYDLQVDAAKKSELLHAQLNNLQKNMEDTAQAFDARVGAIEQHLNDIETKLAILTYRLESARKASPPYPYNAPAKKPKERSVKKTVSAARSVPSTAPVTPKQNIQQGKTKEQPGEDEAKRIFRRAFLALKDTNYDQAVVLYNELLEKHPRSKLVPLAHYWLGEVWLAQGKTRLAISSLQKAVSKPEENPKYDAAMLALARSYRQLGMLRDAEATLIRLIKNHPDSSESQAARNILAQIRGKGEKKSPSR